MLYGKRKKFKKITKTIGKNFSKLGLSPNQWTVLSFVPALTGLYLVYHSFLLKGALLYFLSFFIDIVDGSVARYTNRTSKKGAYVDTIADRYVEFIFLFSILFVSLPEIVIPSQAWIILLLFGSLITTYSKSAAKEKEILKRELKGGLLERAERVFLLAVALAVGSFDKYLMMIIIIGLAFLTNISAFQRISKALGMEDE